MKHNFLLKLNWFINSTYICKRVYGLNMIYQMVHVLTMACKKLYKLSPFRNLCICYSLFFQRYVKIVVVRCWQ